MGLNKLKHLLLVIIIFFVNACGKSEFERCVEANLDEGVMKLVELRIQNLEDKAISEPSYGSTESSSDRLVSNLSEAREERDELIRSATKICHAQGIY